MDVGIVGYGFYVPSYRIRVSDIAAVWGQDGRRVSTGLQVYEKSLGDVDEDTITIGFEAGRNALSMAGINPKNVKALFIGSESHPYAVKPSGTVVAEALDISNDLILVDMEFACKAGTAAMQCCYGLVKSGEIEYGIAIGADTAQGMPGDALEYTAASGGAAFVIGPKPLAIIEGMYSYTTDTPDFWRRDHAIYPRHGSRFTGKPAYFHHVITATNGLFNKLGLNKNDFDYVVFHMPNGRFPKEAAKQLGIDPEKMKQGMIVENVGNTYSGSSLLGLCSVLNVAKPGQRILCVSYGSGAGSDAISFMVTDEILNKTRHDFFHSKPNVTYVDYANYARMRKKIVAEE